jgi:urea transporter
MASNIPDFLIPFLSTGAIVAVLSVVLQSNIDRLLRSAELDWRTSVEKAPMIIVGWPLFLLGIAMALARASYLTHRYARKQKK